MGPRARHVLRLFVVGFVVMALHGARAADVRGVVIGVSAYEDTAIVPTASAGYDARDVRDALAAMDATDGGIRALGVDGFGQCGGLSDLYEAYGIDAGAIVAAFEK